jgi:hypothetical protein
MKRQWPIRVFYGTSMRAKKTKETNAHTHPQRERESTDSLLLFFCNGGFTRT